MKTLEKYIKGFEDYTKPEIKKLNFKFQGIPIKRKGYAILIFDTSETNRREVITFEPVHYSNGDRWLVYGGFCRMHGVTEFYAKNIQEAIKKLNEINTRDFTQRTY